MRYIIKRIINLDYKNFFSKIKDISKKTKRNFFLVLFDVIRCAIKFGAGYMDYWLFLFYEKTDSEKKTFITRKFNDELVRKYNSKEAREYFIHKTLFNKTFKEFIGREYIEAKDLKYEVFSQFIEKHNTVFLKPDDKACGTGIEKVNLVDFKDMKEMFEYATNGNFALIEEPITQHEKMNEMYNFSVNTIRICTLKIDGEVKIFYAAFRIGNEGKVVDNYNAGGMAAPVDINTGVITNSAIDRTNTRYESHPMTKTKILGFQIPLWDECIKCVKKAGEIVPDMGYVGWDVCVTKNGPVLVEGNDFPGHDIQIPKYPGDKTGFRTRYEEMIKV